MTTFGLKYLEYQENARANLARETENMRSNKANEDIRWFDANEGKRHNIAGETETNRSNVAREQENVRFNTGTLRENLRSNQAREFENMRSNMAREAENFRTNVANEGIKKSQVQLGNAELLEQIRINSLRNSTDLYKANLDRLPNISAYGIAGQDMVNRGLLSDTMYASGLIEVGGDKLLDTAKGLGGLKVPDRSISFPGQTSSGAQPNIPDNVTRFPK